MPRVQEHPDHPSGGRKYGVFQKVFLSLHLNPPPSPPSLSKKTPPDNPPQPGNLHQRPHKEQTPDRDDEPEQARRASAAAPRRAQLQLCRWRSRGAGDDGCESVGVSAVEGNVASFKRPAVLCVRFEMVGAGMLILGEDRWFHACCGRRRIET